jgi:hypothetical protein
MNEPDTRHVPSELNLHRKSRALTIAFDDGDETGIVPVSATPPSRRTAERPVALCNVSFFRTIVRISEFWGKTFPVHATILVCSL